MRLHGGYTYVIAFDVRKGKLLGQILCDGAFPTSGGARDDPHVTMVRRVEGAVDLLGRTGRCEIH